MGDQPDPELAVDRAPRSETRISLVLYGGVSLAAYISGCCQELLSLVRATADDVAVPDDELTPVQRVYRRLARDRGPDGRLQRVVVDVLSGSSAGGLNPIYLPKALTHGGRLDGLREVWRREADIVRLLNRATVEGPARARRSTPSTSTSSSARPSTSSPPPTPNPRLVPAAGAVGRLLRDRHRSPGGGRAGPARRRARYPHPGAAAAGRVDCAWMWRADCMSVPRRVGHVEVLRCQRFRLVTLWKLSKSAKIGSGD